ncbi:MAG: GTPase Era [Deinococcus-Thermus bacterium]|nr:GTPase Era [Deinococcota bacterium]
MRFDTAHDADDEVLAPMRAGFVAILGKPNVGKSTLLNTLLGVKVAPITPKPQTTRRGVRGIWTDVENRRQLVFVDTPGLHKGRTALDDFMTREIRLAVTDVEIVLWVVDLRRPPGDEDREVARLLDGIDPATPVYLIGNKLDAAKYPDEAMDLYADLGPRITRRYALSALNDPKAVYALRDDLLDVLPEGPYFFPDTLRSDQPRESWAAEMVRESAMTHLYQELPYAVAVKVDDWIDADPERDAPLILQAEIWVEKPQHRPIVIGQGGRMIREIGRTARKQLEVFLDQKVFLDLEVVVRRDWRMDPEALRELGYAE